MRSAVRLRQVLAFVWIASLGAGAGVGAGAAGVAHAQRPFDVLHTAVTEAVEGKELELNANVKRYRELNELVARYRTKGTTRYRGVTLKRSQSDFFEAKIPGADVKAAGLEYYLVIIDRDGKTRPAFASKEKPQTVKVIAAASGGVTRRTTLEEEFATLTGEEEVVSAARVRQRIEESPSAITVITAEDIRNYGATSIAEVLRTVPGIDYMQISGADPHLSARGFNRELSNRLLTLVDGRSAYVDVFGMTFWEVFPISVWDIDRIEVIRGPGSTLYGANAFGGVVNIFTKSPDQAKGFHFYTQGGAHGFNTTLLAGGKANSFTGYRLSVTHDQISSFDRVTIDDKIGVRGNGLVTFDLPDGAKLALRGGLVRQFFGPTMTLNGPFSTQVNLGYAQVNLDYKNFRFQAWYQGIKGDLSRTFPLPRQFNVPGMATPVPFSALFGNIPIAPINGARPDTVDVESTYTLEPSKYLRMVFGLNYRFNQFTIPSLLEKESTQHLLGVFGQFEIRPHRQLSINLGARLDLLHYTNPVCPVDSLTECLAGRSAKVDVANLVNFSPRAAIVWGLSQSQHLRASGGIAFRNPAFVENLIRYQVSDPGTLGPLLGGGPRPAIIFAGNEKLTAEQLREVELGWGMRLWNRRIAINLDLFYLEGLDLITFQSGSPLAALTGDPRASSTYSNLVDARNYGLELSIRAQLTGWMKAFLNYSYQKVELKDPSLATRTSIDTESPLNKLNFGVNVSHAQSGLFLNLYGHFVGASKRKNSFTAIPNTDVSAFLRSPTFVPLSALTGARSIEDIESYFLLNVNFGYRLFDGQLEIGVAGFNVFGDYGAAALSATGAIADRRHIEYPRLDIQGSTFGGEAIGARVYGFIRGHFR